ncbi:MAG: BlaI/MecI/CopY family transcriptional regulator [Planctomycetaceae bacterium]|nr:BlaI/MecI/CopY family transcriptional regulator [Planctomycetaceae bacterium]
MVDRPALSKGEMAVARALWEVGPATVRQIHQKVEEHEAMNFVTVQTYLRRLEAKGHANSKLDGRVRIYSGRSRPGTVIRSTVSELVDRLFGGDSLPLVRHLIEERNIDESGLAELRQLIDRMEAEQAQAERKSS